MSNRCATGRVLEACSYVERRVVGRAYPMAARTSATGAPGTPEVRARRRWSRVPGRHVTGGPARTPRRSRARATAPRPVVSASRFGSGRACRRSRCLGHRRAIPEYASGDPIASPIDRRILLGAQCRQASATDERTADGSADAARRAAARDEAGRDRPVSLAAASSTTWKLSTSHSAAGVMAAPPGWPGR